MDPFCADFLTSGPSHLLIDAMAFWKEITLPLAFYYFILGRKTRCPKAMAKCGAFQVRHDGSDLSCILPNTSPLSWGRNVIYAVLESLSKDVFEGRTSTGSEPFSLYICLDANKFVLLSFFSLMKRIYPRVSNKPLPNNAKGPLPVDARRSTTLLLKLPIMLRNETVTWRYLG